MEKLRQCILKWLFKDSIYVRNLLNGHMATKEYVLMVKDNIKEELDIERASK